MDQRQGEGHGPLPRRPDATAVYTLFSELIYADQPLTDTLAGVTELARQALNQPWEASLTLVEDRGVWTAVSTGRVASHLDQWQHDSGSGPSLDAARTGTTIELTVAASEQLYPGFRLAARDQGLTHTISVGLSTGDQVRGAMNLYSRSGRPFNADDDRVVRSFAFCAGMVLARVERSRRAASRAAHVEAALHSRTLIEQAKGTLMARHHCTSEEASRMLVELARGREVNLEVVVQAILDES